MKATDITCASRKLAQLKRRLDVVTAVEDLPPSDWPVQTEARRMARELARDIRAQELECRRLELNGPWTVKQSAEPGTWYCVTRDGEMKWINGCKAKALAIAWAERQNAKAKKGGG